MEYEDAWTAAEEAHQAAVDDALADYYAKMSEWMERPIEDRGDEPIYEPPTYTVPEQPMLA